MEGSPTEFWQDAFDVTNPELYTGLLQPLLVEMAGRLDCSLCV